jgi:hypothetical protein
VHREQIVEIILNRVGAFGPVPFAFVEAGHGGKIDGDARVSI